MATRVKKHLVSQDPEYRAKQEKALALRTAGASYRQIAQDLGWESTSSAWHAVQDALRATIAEPTAAVRTLELERLDNMLIRLQDGINEGNVQSIQTALKIQDRRARLLGLDAPAKVAMTDPTGTKEAGSLTDLSDAELMLIVQQRQAAQQTV